MDDFIDSIFNAIKEIWIGIIIIILGYLAWRFNLTKDILAFVSVVVLGYIAFKLWLHYIQQDFISGIKFVLLEIVPPREVLLSPKAMELFLTNALYHWSMKGGVEEYWQGAVWFWHSLEIASFEGQVHFYIRTPTRLKTLVETQLYAQYPQAQVKVAEDYTLAVDEITDRSAWKLWGCEWKLMKPEAYPLKTYVDFGLDKDPKEEYKVDPISPVIELFGSIGKGEQMWVQIIITPSKKKYPEHAHFWQKTHDWVTEAEIVMRKSLAKFTRHHKGGGVGGVDAFEIRAPDFMRGELEGIGQKRLKVGFDTGIRICYVAKRKAFNMNNRRNMRLIFRQYAAPNENELKRINSTQSDAFATGLFSGFFLA